jgi:hypothetical protein
MTKLSVGDDNKVLHVNINK